MDFFSKPLAQLETQDLQDLIEQGAQENVRLEFKREVPSRNEFLKKLSALANTYGGYVVIGAEEDGAGNLRTIPGVEVQRSMKQTLVQWGQGAYILLLSPKSWGQSPRLPMLEGRSTWFMYRRA